MSAVTLSSAKGFSQQATADVAPKQGFFARVLAAIIAARMAKAERELAFYMQRTGFDPRK